MLSYSMYKWNSWCLLLHFLFVGQRFEYLDNISNVLSITLWTFHENFTLSWFCSSHSDLRCYISCRDVRMWDLLCYPQPANFQVILFRYAFQWTFKCCSYLPPDWAFHSCTSQRKSTEKNKRSQSMFEKIINYIIYIFLTHFPFG